MSTVLVVNPFFLLTHLQIQRLERAKLIGNSTLNIHLSNKQVKANVQYRGGFLGMLTGLAAKVIPALFGGHATGLVSAAVEKAVGGHGLHRGDGPVLDYTYINLDTM